MRILFETLIRLNPRFWTAAFGLIFASGLALLSGLLHIELGVVEVLALLICLAVTVKLILYAHTWESVEKIQGRRLYVTGSAVLAGEDQLYAGDLGNSLLGFGGRVLADPENAEFLIYLDRDSGVMRCEDRSGYIERIQLKSPSKFSMAGRLGAFVAWSDSRKRRGRAPRIRVTHPRAQRLILVAALVIQVSVAWHRHMFAGQKRRHTGLAEYVFTVGGLTLTNILIWRAHRSCRLLLEEIRGKRVFVSGAGFNLDNRRVRAHDIARLLGSQGAIIVADRDVADFCVCLDGGESEIQDAKGHHTFVIVDEQFIVRELRKMLRTADREL